MAVDMMGTVFTWNSATVAGVTDLSGPAVENELIEVTNFGSTGGYREYIAGPKDNGEISITINYDPTDSSHNATTGLVADANTGTSRAWSINWSGTGTSWSGNGIVTSFEPGGSFEDALTAEVTIKPTGQPTLA
jgi:predicted secreted protein